jgi:universal stress protein E
MMKLLCATDLETGSEAAIDRAHRLRDALGATLSLVHVVPPLAAEQGTLEQRLLSASSRLAQRARHAGGAAELVVRCGRPATVVSAEARTADLVVVGPHANDDISSPLRGTFIERLLPGLRSPVLVARRPAREPYRRWLLALDGSEASAQVVRAAERLPLADDSELAVVHAHEPPYEAMMNSAGLGNLSVASYAAASMSHAAAVIHTQLRLHSLDWRRYRVMLMDARAPVAIRQAMHEFAPDLLVMGTRGHGRFRRAILGSTAHEALRSADCDVLLVPENARRGSPPPNGDDTGPAAA